MISCLLVLLPLLRQLLEQSHHLQPVEEHSSLYLADSRSSVFAELIALLDLPLQGLLALELLLELLRLSLLKLFFHSALGAKLNIVDLLFEVFSEQ